MGFSPKPLSAISRLSIVVSLLIPQGSSYQIPGRHTKFKKSTASSTIIVWWVLHGHHHHHARRAQRASNKAFLDLVRGWLVAASRAPTWNVMSEPHINITFLSEHNDIEWWQAPAWLNPRLWRWRCSPSSYPNHSRSCFRTNGQNGRGGSRDSIPLQAYTWSHTSTG